MSEYTSSTHPTVQLVVMPYADIYRPSLAVGLLQGALLSNGISCQSVYANLKFAEILSPHIPDPSHLKRLLGEWSFSKAAFRSDAPLEELPDVVFRDDYLPRSATKEPAFREAMLCIRNELAPAFVDDLARQIVAESPKIVGCSSTFEQHCAALALLRRVKELEPAIVTLIGGANCESEMGQQTVDSFEWVDYAVSGEADELITPLCELALKHGADIPRSELPYGVLTGSPDPSLDASSTPIPRATIEDMDQVALPDFRNYFEELERYSYRDTMQVGLMVETSRGCWWGQKHPCTFCGLNGMGMSFRAKSPERAVHEIQHLAKTYGVARFMVVDNILDQGYLKTVLPALAEKGAPFDLFFETKANLKYREVKTLKAAGVNWIQPGIESFSNNLLRLMDKGAHGLQNIALLKYTRELGIFTVWLLLHSFPNEDDDDHSTVAGFLPKLHHLQPPKSVSTILFDRFSVYHKNPAKYDLELRPAEEYNAVYPIEAGAMSRLCYYFEDAKQKAMAPGARRLGQAMLEWHLAFTRNNKPVLTVEETALGLSIFDTRSCATSRRHQLTGLDAEVHQLIASPSVPSTLVSKTGRTHNEIQESLDRLSAAQLTVELDGKFLSLAVSGTIPTLRPIEEFPGGHEKRRPLYATGDLDLYRDHLSAQAKELDVTLASRQDHS